MTSDSMVRIIINGLRMTRDPENKLSRQINVNSTTLFARFEPKL